MVSDKSRVKSLDTTKPASAPSFIPEKLRSPGPGKKKSSITFVDRTDSLTKLVDSLHGLPKEPPSLYVDLEGVNLSRNGSVSILQIYVAPRDETILVDILSLQEKAFSRPSSKVRTLRQVLEDPSIPKVFFDVRKDSDALFSHYGVRLAGAHDLQVMEIATRRGDRTHVLGLPRCIWRHAGLTEAEFQEWNEVKQRGKKLFTPECGGSYEIFNVRPLPDEIREYCVQDVQFLPRLWDSYHARLNTVWKRKVQQEVENRIRESQSPEYVPHGEHMVKGPVGLQGP